MVKEKGPRKAGRQQGEVDSKKARRKLLRRERLGSREDFLGEKNEYL
jgi:hypothetical protein